MKKENEAPGKITPLMKQYWDIKSKYSDMILFFHLGDFYEMFADDAVKAAPVLEVALTKRAGMTMCGLPFKAAPTYIKKLIDKGLKVAICDQIDDPKLSKGIVKRAVTKVITPGTILEDILLESKENNFIMSILFDEQLKTCAVCASDISTGDFFVLETPRQSFEAEIGKYNPGEIIVSKDMLLKKEIAQVLEKLKLPISTIDNSYFELENSKNTILEIFGAESLKKFSLDKATIICSCGALLSYIKEMQPQSIGIFSNIKYLKTCDFMLLDANAIKNLELLKSSSTGKSENSLFYVLDSTKTPMGARLLRQWLVNPLLDISKIENRQNIVDFFIEKADIRKEITEKLKGVSDIERIMARTASNSANPKELNALRDSLKIISENCELVNSQKILTLDLPDNKQIQNKISEVLLGEPSIVLKDGNVIRTGVSEALDELRIISSDTKTYISDLESKERKSTGIGNLKIGYTSVFGYYIEVSKSNTANVPKHYVRKQTITNGERYITDELKIFEEKVLSCDEKILRIESELFNNLRREIAVFAEQILRTSQIISEIDVLCGFAKNALECNYTRPKITNGKELFIEEGRHPVVEKILKNGEFTANDVSFDENSKVIILTGPNMSGKSTYLRQTALIAIMAQIGSFVPAKSAQIGVINRVFTRIGAGDNLAGGESTFMVEMTETANILNSYDDRSLIILDEIGRGTSTYDGMSIAWAIIEHFADDRRKANSGVKVLFATHYFELTELANSIKDIVNFSVDVREWNGDVIFLHKIIKGNANKSYGIHVAKIAGIPRQVIEKAYKILNKLEANAIDVQKQKENTQKELFCNTEPQIIFDLKTIDLNALSPIDAFNILREWKKKYCENS
ncbi:MAG: DNA mismatch repair protein MutS [Elusimicrobiota bacterium]|jgi:DNA mismatch repair protein MutS|nr:DNA mismatch repair protein MutS [Elusimicrobiota bacterium]